LLVAVKVDKDLPRFYFGKVAGVTLLCYENECLEELRIIVLDESHVNSKLQAV